MASNAHVAESVYLSGYSNKSNISCSKCFPSYNSITKLHIWKTQVSAALSELKFFYYYHILKRKESFWIAVIGRPDPVRVKNPLKQLDATCSVVDKISERRSAKPEDGFEDIECLQLVEFAKR